MSQSVRRDPGSDYANIALTGFMAAGKTVVGRRLARSLGWSFVDLDAVIEAGEGTPVREIFADHGEGYFRKCEKAALGSVMEGFGQVVALGGGAVVDPDNLRLLKKRSLLIWLRVSPRTVLRRTRGDTDRPLLGPVVKGNQGGNLPATGSRALPGSRGNTGETTTAAADETRLKRIEELSAQREGIYAEADVAVSTDDLTVDQVVQRIQQQLCRP